MGIMVLVPLTAHADDPLYLPAAEYAVGTQPHRSSRSMSTATAGSTSSRPTPGTEPCRCSWARAPGLLGPATSMAVGGSPTTVSAGDFNHDGDPDLAVTAFATSPATPAVSVLLGSAGASFGPPVTYPLALDALVLARWRT